MGTILQLNQQHRNLSTVSENNSKMVKEGRKNEDVIRDTIRYNLLSVLGHSKMAEYDVIDGKTVTEKTNPVLFNKLSINGKIPDVDIVVVHNRSLTPMVLISVKMSMKDTHSYNTLWHMEAYTKKEIPYVVVTKCETFKTGNSKYLNFFEPVVNGGFGGFIFINKAMERDGHEDETALDYTYNNVVRPFSELVPYIVDKLKDKINESINKFW